MRPISDTLDSPARRVAGEVGMTFHHVGVAVESIETALETYVGAFGFRQVAEPVEVQAENVRVCFVEADPGVMIELVEGVSDDSPVADLLQRRGAGPYHICYLVQDLDEAIRKLRAHRCRPFRRFECPAHGLRRFAFLVTPDLQVFELCEKDSTEPTANT